MPGQPMMQPMMQQPGQPMMMQPGQPGVPMMQQPMPGQPVAQHVIVTQTISTSPYAVGHWPDHPVTITCQYCNHTAMTHVDEDKGTLAWILCIILCLVGCWLGCCCIPFCISSCNDQEHKCQHCKKTVGYRKSMWEPMLLQRRFISSKRVISRT